MRVILVNPSQKAIYNLKRTRDETLEWYTTGTAQEVMVKLEEMDIDMVLVFLKELEANILADLITVFSRYPSLKVIGLADLHTSGIIDLLKNTDIIPLQTIADENNSY